ncbi:hypothetical protein C8A00DRAFT_13667 [Chaetomidium leptoderma]|uniref:Uncharacterized protein n=1 Tax=Chaetomidium leptoderma TaxID=669021 RepID=A0AAN6VP99_9PEZI|nr:hypothetical protein C8A00DRAFT_13667 [Chaetomidium leptoderma]
MPERENKNSGSCTAAKPNPKYSEWVRNNPTKSKSLCPHPKTIACTCSRFAWCGSDTYKNKCTCNHDNKVHN